MSVKGKEGPVTCLRVKGMGIEKIEGLDKSSIPSVCGKKRTEFARKDRIRYLLRLNVVLIEVTMIRGKGTIRDLTQSQVKGFISKNK